MMPNTYIAKTVMVSTKVAIKLSKPFQLREKRNIVSIQIVVRAGSVA